MEEFFSKLLELTECNKIEWVHPYYYCDEYRIKHDYSSWKLTDTLSKTYLDIRIHKTLWLWYCIRVENEGAFWFPRWKDSPVKQIYELLKKREDDAKKSEEQSRASRHKQKLDNLVKLSCS